MEQRAAEQQKRSERSPLLFPHAFRLPTLSTDSTRINSLHAVKVELVTPEKAEVFEQNKKEFHTNDFMETMLYQPLTSAL
ncbi:hypothetical protein H7C18_32110 [Cohnella sp. CBP 2801]|uniref:Uncharacterized protein n=1 Tax=Cohnella zeiphila TaxID=2761120 RepID=A0A7X0VZB8_9BACL|nr:hypothetical protein [Cohnella zeiphila]